MIVLLIPLIIFVTLIVLIALSDKKKSERDKAFTETSIKFLIGVFFSGLASIIIALNADMPDNIGFGGFIYIIGPGVGGLLILYAYLISLWLYPKQKLKLGIISITLNIAVGFIFMLFVK
jgi:hypothetical protein